MFSRRNTKEFETDHIFFLPEHSLRKRDLIKFVKVAKLSFLKEVLSTISKIVSVMFCWLIALLF